MVETNDIIKIGLIILLVIFLYRTEQTNHSPLGQNVYMFQYDCEHTGGKYSSYADSKTLKMIYQCKCDGVVSSYNSQTIFGGCNP